MHSHSWNAPCYRRDLAQVLNRGRSRSPSADRMYLAGRCSKKRPSCHYFLLAIAILSSSYAAPRISCQNKISVSWVTDSRQRA